MFLKLSFAKPIIGRPIPPLNIDKRIENISSLKKTKKLAKVNIENLTKPNILAVKDGEK
jgi:hypothetical protein